MNKRCRLLIICGLLTAAVIPAADAAYLLAKATLAQHLIANAWQQSIESSEPHSDQRIKPWPWADTHPVARLRISALDLDTWVLNGASGTSLAFGPGLNEGSSPIGENGLVMIGAHRDTHFKNLDRIQVGQKIDIQDNKRQWHTYRVTHKSVADSRTDTLPNITDSSRLALVTCYPLDALLPGGPLRYVVEAEKFITTSDLKEL